MDFPTVSRELIEALRRSFPPSPPDEYETLEELRVRAGEQKVINRLVREWKQQNDNILEREVR
jgi:DNA-binding transcriptional regulator YbjK